MHVKITTVPYDAAAANAAASGPAQAPIGSTPADAFAPGPAGYKVAMDADGKAPVAAPASDAPRYRQPAAAVASLALAALVALVA